MHVSEMLSEAALPPPCLHARPPIAAPTLSSWRLFPSFHCPQHCRPSATFCSHVPLLLSRTGPPVGRTVDEQVSCGPSPCPLTLHTAHPSVSTFLPSPAQ